MKWIRAVTAATGIRVGHNVRDLYGELARVFDPGDRIYLFGFSRGAFTVRMLSGLIAWCGIVDRRDPGVGTNAKFKAAIDARYSDYRRLYQTAVSRLFRTFDREEFRKKYAADVERCKAGKTHLIDFIGVWDTVDAVGLPLRIADVVNATVYRFKFPNRHLSPEVAAARHALAVDEQRESFAPVLWCERPQPHTCGTRPASGERGGGGDARIKQVWFAGVHSNIGGGYPNQGMSLVALDWMMSEAESPDLPNPLRFIPEQRQLYRGAADVNSKLYDSRAGFGVFYRWKPRDAEQLCAVSGVPRRVHRTVFERIARNTDGYAPGSLPPDCEIITTSAGQSVKEAIASCVRDAHSTTGGRSFTATEAGLVAWGRLSYVTFMTATVLLVGFTLGNFLVETVLSPLGIAQPTSWSAWTALPGQMWGALDGMAVRKVAAAAIQTGVSSHWVVLLARNVVRSPWIVGLFVAAFLMSYAVDLKLDRVYSASWFLVRNCLLTALHAPAIDAAVEEALRAATARAAGAGTQQT